MKTALACLLSSVIVGFCLAVYSIIENGFQVEAFGLMLIAFLYALIVATVIGVPLRYFLMKLGIGGSASYAAAGFLLGIGIPLTSIATSRHLDTSVLKLTVVLAMAGFLAGWTFNRVSNSRSTLA